MAAQAIEFSGVSKIYRKGWFGQQIPALNDISFQVAAGEVCAFLGPNGAGKTTSISILMGFIYANAGEVCVLGCPPGDVGAKKRIGFLPENFAFYKHMTAPQLLRLHLALAGRRPTDHDPLIAGLLRKVGLADYPHLKVGKYSRGMVQRLGIAQALLGDPDLLVFDEPTSGLDPAGRKEVRDLILALKAAGKTVFLSSHLLSEVEQICDRVIIIDKGRAVRAGPLEDLLVTSDRAEIVVDQVPAHLEEALKALGAVVDRGPQKVRIVIGAAQEKPVVEMLWAADCNVISLNPLRSSLEEMFFKAVSDGANP